MKEEIVRFVRKVCERYGCNAFWMAGREGGTYVIHKNGRAIQNFSLKDFYQLPKKYRFFMMEPLIKRGMMTNLGGQTKEQLFSHFKLGKKIA